MRFSSSILLLLYLMFVGQNPKMSPLFGQYLTLYWTSFAFFPTEEEFITSGINFVKSSSCT